MKKIIFTLACLTALPACTVRQIALRTTAGILERGVSAFYEEEDIPFARDSMTSHLKLLEGFLKNDPGNKKLLFSLAQGFGGYSFLFMEDESPERAKYFYKKARDYGLLILGDKMSDLSRVTADEAPALFWTAYAWGGWANLNRTDPQALADLPKVEAMIRRVEELKPGYFYEGANLFLGAYYGSRPRIFGGDLGKSKKYFEGALKNSGRKFLMGQVLYAKYYAVFAQDRDLFQSVLNEVVNAPKDLLPEQALSNQVAKEKAKKLLEKIDELF